MTMTGTVIPGMTLERLRQRLAEGIRPEGHIAVVVTGGNGDDDLDQPAEVGLGTNLHRQRTRH